MNTPTPPPDLIVRPIVAFKTAGYPSHTLDPKRHYPAIHAVNQPDWVGKGLVFVAFDGSHPEAGTADTLLLEEGDYEIISPAVTAV